VSWLAHFAAAHPIAHALLLLALVSASGLACGNIRLRGIGLGIAGVLFSGLVFGHFGLTIDPAILEFARDFGLVLFVYTIGMQVGPGFTTSLRKQGLPLNLMAAAIVLLGAACTLLIAWLGRIDIAVAVGLFTGGTTNTPALGAAQEALRSMAGIDPARLALPTLGYAVAYPFGVRRHHPFDDAAPRVFSSRCPKSKMPPSSASQRTGSAPLERMSLEVENPNLAGVMITRSAGPP
jgi:putative transport protein